MRPVRVQGKIVGESWLQKAGFFLVGSLIAFWHSDLAFDPQAGLVGMAWGWLMLLLGLFAMAWSAYGLARAKAIVFGADRLQIVRGSHVLVQIPYANIADVDSFGQTQWSMECLKVMVRNPSDPDTFCPRSEWDSSAGQWCCRIDNEWWKMDSAEVHRRLWERLSEARPDAPPTPWRREWRRG